MREHFRKAVLAFPLVLALATAAVAADATSQSTVASNATSQTTTESNEPAAEAAWPPGLIMEALAAMNASKTLDDLSFRIYGYEEAGFTGRLTGGQDELPLRAFDARRPNNVRQNQLSLTAERVYDTNKTFDFGGKVQGLFGGDAMLTHSRGLFPYSGVGEGDAWADLFQAYLTAWIGTGKDSGLEVLVGKFSTPFGYEATEPVNAPLYSHSFLFNLAPFTHTGIKLTYNFATGVNVYAGIVNGWDNFSDNNHAHSYFVGGAWQSAETIGDNPVNSATFCLITGPEQDDDVNDYRTAMDASFTHRWTEKLSQAVELNFGTERRATDEGERDRWYGVAHYLTYTFCDCVTGTWRTEWVRNEKGAATGYAGNLYENTLGLNITPWSKDKVLKNLSFRPEVRWDFARHAAFGDDHCNQLTAAIDVVFKF